MQIVKATAPLKWVRAFVPVEKALVPTLIVGRTALGPI